MAICIECGENYNQKRADLGYTICLECGQQQATQQTNARNKQVTIAYNKGPYMLITNKEQVKGIFKVCD